jgi:hypothetical protein
MSDHHPDDETIETTNAGSPGGHPAIAFGESTFLPLLQPYLPPCPSIVEQPDGSLFIYERTAADASTFSPGWQIPDSSPSFPSANETNVDRNPVNNLNTTFRRKIPVRGKGSFVIDSALSKSTLDRCLPIDDTPNTVKDRLEELKSFKPGTFHRVHYEPPFDTAQALSSDGQKAVFALLGRLVSQLGTEELYRNQLNSVGSAQSEPAHYSDEDVADLADLTPRELIEQCLKTQMNRTFGRPGELSLVQTSTGFWGISSV